MARKRRKYRRGTDEVQLKLRFQEWLRDLLARAAKRNGRSLNAEIIHRLRESFDYDLIRKEADSLVRETLSFDASGYADIIGRDIKVLLEGVMKRMAEAHTVAAQKQKTKPDNDGDDK
jgi:Arc-like DNA binding domain